MKYNVIIIGGGPAGLTAGIYAGRAGKKVLLIENYAIGGQAALSHEIVNYSGIKSISGFELTNIIQQQAESFGTEILYDNIKSISLEGEIKQIETEYSGKFVADEIILAMGTKERPLGDKREKEFIGKGISYCATCDGNFFKDKTVAVVGGGNTALTDAIYLSKIAKKVYIIHRRNEYRGSPDLAIQIKELGVEEILSSEVTNLIGEEKLSAIEVSKVDSKEKHEIEVDGLFVAIGTIPQNDLIKDEVYLENGYIVTDSEMRTNIKGVFAVGDIRKKSLRQVITACSDGAIAAFNLKS